MTENYVNPDKKMVVIFTHGMGDQSNEPKCSKKYATKFEKSYTKMQNRLEKHFRKFGKNEHGDEEYYLDRIRFTPILWAEELQKQQEILKENVVKCKYQITCKEKKLKYWTWLRCLRKFMIDFLSDAIVYQKTKTSRLMYDNVQKVFLKELKELVDETSNGVGEDSPLCIIAHSMGSIITENLIYDLQDMKSTGRWENAEITPMNKLDKGETLEFYYTMGNPLALWSSRREPPGFGTIINVKHWVNFYSKNDVISYPLGNLNDCYRIARCNAEENGLEYPVDEGDCKFEKDADNKIITKLIDKRVSPGGPLTIWNPGCHNKYWTCRKIIKTIVKDITEYIP